MYKLFTIYPLWLFYSFIKLLKLIKNLLFFYYIFPLYRLIYPYRFQNKSYNDCMHVQLLSCIWLFCNPMDYSPPGSSVHGFTQERILEWVAIPSPGDLPNPGFKSVSPALAGRLFTTEPTGKICTYLWLLKVISTFYYFFINIRVNSTTPPTFSMIKSCGLILYMYFQADDINVKVINRNQHLHVLIYSLFKCFSTFVYSSVSITPPLLEGFPDFFLLLKVCC